MKASLKWAVSTMSFEWAEQGADTFLLVNKYQ